MGMYTEIFVNVDFNEETPDSVLDVIRVLVGDICSDSEKGKKLLEGFPPRFDCLFHNMSCYTTNTSCKSLTYDPFGENYSLIGKGDLKNYDDEIETFFRFIEPWVESPFMGYSMYEENYTPNLMYAKHLLE